MVFDDNNETDVPYGQGDGDENDETEHSKNLSPVESPPSPNKHHRHNVSWTPTDAEIMLPKIITEQEGASKMAQRQESDVSQLHEPHLLIPISGAEQQDDDCENLDATWGDVGKACCCHSSSEWMHIFGGIVMLLGLLYFFLLGLELLSTSFRVVGGCTAEALLGSDTNPVASLMIGILVTAILQSSSTVTAIVVSLVGGGLAVEPAIYLVMGANIGTAVTAILVSMAHMQDKGELERAFAGATVVWVFKILTVIVLFPVEIASGYLYKLTKAMLPSEVGDGESWEGPIKKIISPLSNLIIIANKEMIDDIASGAEPGGCDAFYPTNCTRGVESYRTCDTGLIGCSSKTNRCPAFFQNGASEKDDMVSGWVSLIFALVLLIVCLLGLVALLRQMLLGASQRIIYKATNINGYLGMMIGCGATILVQSSSITISTLVPLIAMGVLQLEQMYPITLGADIGTTFTALMAAMVSNSVDSLQVALVHLFFNLTGILMWYPIPFLRRIPMYLARRLGKATRLWRVLPLAFLTIAFFLLPLLILGISVCFEQGTKGFVALGTFLVLIFGGSLVYFWFWCQCRSGKEKCRQCLSKRNRRRMAVDQLADDMDYLKVDMEYCKNEIGRLKDYARLVRRGEGPPRRPPSAHGSVYTQEQEDAISLYETCRSERWPNLLVAAARSSVEGSLQLPLGSTAPHIRGPTSTIHSSLSGTERTHSSFRRRQQSPQRDTSVALVEASVPEQSSQENDQVVGSKESTTASEEP